MSETISTNKIFGTGLNDLSELGNLLDMGIGAVKLLAQTHSD